MKKIAIIGAGACGLWTALAISQSEAGIQIDIYERFDNIGKKISMSGNSRGNVSNLNVRPEAYNVPSFVKPILTRYDARWAYQSFEQFGIKVAADEAGRVYPISEHAKSIVLTFKRLLTDKNIYIYEQHWIEDITYRNDKKQYIINDNIYDAVVIATGSNAGLGPKVTGSMYPTINHINPFKETNRFPALCAIGVKDDLRVIENIRVKAKVSLILGNEIYGAKGEIQFINQAISGIATFVLSSYIAREIVKYGHVSAPCLLVVDLLPSLSFTELINYLSSNLDVSNFHPHALTGLFHQHLSSWIHKRYQEASQANFDIYKLAELIKQMTFTFDESYIAKNNQILAGGIDTTTIDNQTLEHRSYQNLFIGGEALDVDGLCGGYNLHFAFASGETIAKEIIKRRKDSK